MLKALGDGDMTAGHARAILSLTNPADQRILFNRIRDVGLSVRKAEEQSQLLSSGNRRREKGREKSGNTRKREPEMAEYEKRLLTKYGTKAEIQGSLSAGKIVLHYYTAEDLDRILTELI